MNLQKPEGQKDKSQENSKNGASIMIVIVK